MRKLWLVIGLLLISTNAYSWTGSDTQCILKYSKGSGSTTRVYLPAAIYGIVANGTSAVDYHFIQIYNNTSAVTPDIQTWCTNNIADLVFTDTVQDRNVASETRLLSDVLIKQGQNSIVFGRRYVVILRVKDINGLWSVDWSYVYFLPRSDE